MAYARNAGGGFPKRHAPVEPGQQLLGAVIGVHEHSDTVGHGDVADVVCTGHGTKNRSLLLAVGKRFAREEVRATLRELNHDRAIELGGCLQDRVA